MFSYLHIMKYLILLASFVMLFMGKASAQADTVRNVIMPDFSTPVASKNIAAEVGHQLAVCDTVVDFRVVNADLTLLNLGGRYPNQTLTIAIKGANMKVNVATMKGKAVCFFGEVVMFKNKPEILVTRPEQIMDIKKYQ